MMANKKISLRNYLLIVFVALLLPMRSHAVEQPNFLVITVDDLKRVIGVLGDRPGNLLNQLYPDPQVRASIKAVLTPNIDQLAANGILFANTYAVAPVCNPSRISLATGTRPDITGFTTNKDLFREDAAGASLVTMQQNLRNNGYFASGVGKIFHKSKISLSADGGVILEDWPDTQYSWDTWLNRTIGSSGTINYSPYSTMNGAITFGSVTAPLEQQNDYLNATYIADLLDDGSSVFYDSVYEQQVAVSLPTDAPFYLGLGVYLPHQPFVAPPEIISLFDPELMQLDAQSLQAIRDDLLDLSPGGKAATGADGQITTEFQKLLQKGLEQDGVGGDLAAWKAVIQHYLAAVAVADRSVGVVLDALASSAYRDNTVVVLHSDHGFNLGEKNRLGKNDVWDESTGSVLIISRPGVLPAVVENSVSLQDLYPTITALAQVELPAGVLGNDLSAYFSEPALNWAKPNFTSQGLLANRHSIRTNHYRYVRFYDDASDAELYDLRNDPNELVNLIADAEYQNEREALNLLLDNIRANSLSTPVMVELDDVFSDADYSIDATINVEAWQATGEVVSFSATGLPNGVVIDNQSGVISGKPASNGLFFPTIEAASVSGRDTTNFTWAVTGGDDNSSLGWTDPNLEVIATGTNTVELSWSGAVSTTSIAGYQISVETPDSVSEPILVTGTTTTVENLQPATQHLITVQVVDDNGAISIDGPYVFVETRAVSTDVDSNPPYWEAGSIELSDIKPNSATVSWSEAQDDAGVVAYAVILDGELLGTTSDNFYTLDNLAGGITYVLEVQAIDAAENTSSALLSLEVMLEGGLPPEIYFSTLSAAPIPGLGQPFDDATVYTFNGSVYAKYLIASELALDAAVDVNAMAIGSSESLYLSFNNDAMVPGIGSVSDKDIVEYRNGEWSVYLAGSEIGLTKAAHDIDGLSYFDDTLYFSIVGPVSLPGVGVVDDADILKWTGSRIEKHWDATDNGLPAIADINGLDVFSGNHYLMSFNAADTNIPVLGNVQDEDIVEYNNGVWSVYFDGTATGLVRAGHEIDALSVGFASAATEPGDTSPPGWLVREATVLSLTASSVQLQWPEAEDDTAVAGYNVTYTVGQTSVVLASNDNTVTIEDLAPGTAYTFEIQATDEAGNVSIDGPVVSVVTDELAEPAVSNVYFSTVGSTAIAGVAGSADDADVYSWDGVSLARRWDATDYGLTSGADIDAISFIADEHFYVSFGVTNTSVPGLGLVQDEDVLEYNNGTWSVYFDGTAAGLVAGGHDIDGLSVVGQTMYFSTLGDSKLPGFSSADDADIYAWNAGVFSRFWDATQYGVSSSGDIDALIVLGDEHFVVSFTAAFTYIAGYGSVPDENLVQFKDGEWTLYFDGTANGLTSGGLDIDAVGVLQAPDL